MEINLDLNEYSNTNFQIEKENTDSKARIRNISHNLLGEVKYNIPEIINNFKFLSGKEIINEVSRLLKEKKKNVIENIFKKTEKEEFVAILEKTLRIQNEGGYSFTRHRRVLIDGVKTLVQEKLVKSPGGVFFSIAKKDCNFSKQDIKLIFDYEKYIEREQEKLSKELTKMII